MKFSRMNIFANEHFERSGDRSKKKLKRLNFHVTDMVAGLKQKPRGCSSLKIETHYGMDI